MMPRVGLTEGVFMNWEAIGAVSGLLSAVALIATLGYVAVQL
jgi:hypothetical protein